MSTNPRSSQDTTADSKSMIESIIIGANQIQIKSKILNTIEQDKVKQATNAILAANNITFDAKRSSPELSIVQERVTPPNLNESLNKTKLAFSNNKPG